MAHRTRRRTALVAALTALALGPVAVLGVAAPVPASASAPASAPTGPAEASTDCAAVGLEVAAVVDGTVLCTTGPEPGDPAVEAGAVAEASSGIQCYGDGASGARVQLVYAHPPSLNRLASLEPAMRTRAAQMESIFDASAAQTGGRRHIRWATDPNCNLQVLDVTVDGSALPSTNFTALINALVAKGHSDPDRKYVIWAETANANPSLCSGLATLWYDTRTGEENWNDAKTGYARLDETCLRSVFDGRTEAHELMHTIGGVQPGAPNATPAGHCRDEADRMCYDDDGAGGVSMRSVCSSANELRFDCGHDDYFYANAPCGAGGWLASRWNSADSRWLEAVAASAAPAPANDRLGAAASLTGYSGSLGTTNAGAGLEAGEPSPTGKPGGRSLWFRWTAPVSGPVAFDTCGSDVDTLLAVSTGTTGSMTGLAPVGASDDDSLLGRQSRVTFTAQAGTTYLVQVDGKGGEQGPLALRWGAPHHGYPDVALGAWYEAAVNWMARFDLIDPRPGGGFGPKTKMTRREVVNVLWRLADRPSARSTATFADVPATAWYLPALSWAVEAGLVKPYPDGTFHPGATVKRGHLADMLWRLAGTPAGSPASGFSDVASTHKLAPAIDWAAAEGLVSPYPDGTFRRKKALTRQQISVILFDLASSPDAWAEYGGAPPSAVVFPH
ncbi:MAG: S-layer homology domain-containing protein [Microthrixaceae bacterium]|nr:S-layer homology domain-containing protein [Microthrixaceae bacterium]